MLGLVEVVCIHLIKPNITQPLAKWTLPYHRGIICPIINCYSANCNFTQWFSKNRHGVVGKSVRYGWIHTFNQLFPVTFACRNSQKRVECTLFTIEWKVDELKNFRWECNVIVFSLVCYVNLSLYYSMPCMERCGGDFKMMTTKLSAGIWP